MLNNPSVRDIKLGGRNFSCVSIHCSSRGNMESHHPIVVKPKPIVMRISRFMCCRPGMKTALWIGPDECNSLTCWKECRIVDPRNVNCLQWFLINELVVSPLIKVLRIIHSAIVPNVVPSYIGLIVQNPSLRSEIPVVKHILRYVL